MWKPCLAIQAANQSSCSDLERSTSADCLEAVRSGRPIHVVADEVASDRAEKKKKGGLPSTACTTIFVTRQR